MSHLRRRLSAAHCRHRASCAWRSAYPSSSDARVRRAVRALPAPPRSCSPFAPLRCATPKTLHPKPLSAFLNQSPGQPSPAPPAQPPTIRCRARSASSAPRRKFSGSGGAFGCICRQESLPGGCALLGSCASSRRFLSTRAYGSSLRQHCVGAGTPPPFVRACATETSAVSLSQRHARATEESVFSAHIQVESPSHHPTARPLSPGAALRARRARHNPPLCARARRQLAAAARGGGSRQLSAAASCLAAGIPSCCRSLSHPSPSLLRSVPKRLHLLPPLPSPRTRSAAGRLSKVCCLSGSSSS